MADWQEEVRFLGATGTVTGSRFVISCDRHQVLVDCGMFQGLKELRLRNWDKFEEDPRKLSAVLLTHAHIDHTGWLPRLVKLGFEGPIYATPATIDLVKILLRDAAHMEEENADYANRKGFSRHTPALPLFNLRDVERVEAMLQPVDYEEPKALRATGMVATFRMAGHILGSASIRITLPSGRAVVCSGDVGRYDYPILPDPEPMGQADLLLVESTYGNRLHESLDATRGRLAEIVKRSMARGGILLVPAFAVGRTQTLLYDLRRLEDAGEIPVLSIYVDSPMAIAVSRHYQSRTEEHDDEARRMLRKGARTLYPRGLHYTSSVQESQRLNQIEGPAIIISASGMMTGGRILHHARNRLNDERNTLLLVGYQALGTRGRTLLEGAPSVKIFGEEVPVQAALEQLDGLSAHADQDELLRWLGGFDQPPGLTCLVHGEPEALSALAGRIHQQRGWNVMIPNHGDRVPLPSRP